MLEYLHTPEFHEKMQNLGLACLTVIGLLLLIV